MNQIIQQKIQELTQYNTKDRLRKLYNKYLLGDLTREEYEELFDMIDIDANKSLVESVIDGTIPGELPIPINASLKGYNSKIQQKSSTYIGKSRRLILQLSAAAAILILIASLFFLFNSSEKWIVYTTDFQETKKVELPDGSFVTLNANSELKYVSGMESQQERVVHFSGEGYFDVAHMDERGFTVKTGLLNVNVLGTEFNLDARRHHTNVFLKEGKVVLEGRDITPVQMEPGDLVRYDTKDKKVSKIRSPSSGNALSWKEGMFTFEDLTGIQILEKMEDIYGKKFIIKEPGRLSDVIMVQGLPYTDWDFTQEALELALEVEFIESTTNKIIVKIK